MRIAAYLLYRLARKWPAPPRALSAGSSAVGTAYHLDYAMKMQYMACVRNGVKADILGKEILEIGCGHGGITCFLALNGAKKVTGIDLNTQNLGVAEQFQKQLIQRLFGDSEHRLQVDFLERDASACLFADAAFDLVWAENVFEHFTDPAAVMKEAFRVLRPGGQLVVPVFSSIYSKYGTHTKQGLKVPWANLFFSEATICAVLYRMAQDQPRIFDMYPGLIERPEQLKDLRKYRDLNDITYGKFRKMAREAGFEIRSFEPRPPAGWIGWIGRLLRRVPLLRDGILGDVFSTGAATVLQKPI